MLRLTSPVYFVYTPYYCMSIIHNFFSFIILIWKIAIKTIYWTLYLSKKKKDLKAKKTSVNIYNKYRKNATGTEREKNILSYIYLRHKTLRTTTLCYTFVYRPLGYWVLTAGLKWKTKITTQFVWNAYECVCVAIKLSPYVQILHYHRVSVWWKCHWCVLYTH